MTLEQLATLRLSLKDQPDSELKSTLLELINQSEDHLDFLHFMSTEVDRIPCCHTEGEHKGTPPMMWPELIRCMIKHAVEEDRKKQNAAAGPYGS